MVFIYLPFKIVNDNFKNKYLTLLPGTYNMCIICKINIPS